MTNKDRFLKMADNAIQQVEKELKKNMSERSEKIADKQLKYILQKIHAMKGGVVNDIVPPKERRYNEIGYMVVSEWSIPSKMGQLLIELENFYIKYL